MKHEPRQVVLDLLDALEAMHGPPHSAAVPILKVVAAWHLALEELTDEEIARATPIVLRSEFFGKWPKGHDVFAAARGRTIKVPEYARDLGGERFRSSLGGPLVVERWHEIRVPLNWSGDPGSLDFLELPPELVAWNELEKLELGGPNLDPHNSQPERASQ